MWYIDIYIYDMYLYIYMLYTHIYIYFATLCLFAIAVPTHARRWHFHQHVWWSLVAGYPVMAAAYAQNCINTHMNFPQWLCWSWILLLANVFSPSRNMLCVKKDLRFFHKQEKKLSHHAFGKLVRSSGLLRSIVDKWWHMMLMRGGEGHFVFSFLSTKFTLKHGENLSVLYEFHTIGTCIHGEFPSQPMFNYPPRRMYPNSIVI